MEAKLLCLEKTHLHASNQAVWQVTNSLGAPLSQAQIPSKPTDILVAGSETNLLINSLTEVLADETNKPESDSLCEDNAYWTRRELHAVGEIAAGDVERPATAKVIIVRKKMLVW
ncbi:hypothetical protein MMC28_008785 [Mycoblastus sanguinarius]|nr:hypothetical protein [Mycoblastus sanguinarius]